MMPQYLLPPLLPPAAEPLLLPTIREQSDIVMLVHREFQGLQEHRRKAQEHGWQALLHAKALGDLLIEFKSQVEQRKWMEWIKQHCPFSQRSANAYMDIARNWYWLIEQLALDANMRYRNYSGARQLLSAYESPQQNDREQTIKKDELLFAAHVAEFNIFLKGASRQMKYFKHLRWQGSEVRNRIPSTLTRLKRLKTMIEVQIEAFEELIGIRNKH